MRAAIYARVSTTEQEKEGYSIPAQLKAIRKYAFDNGINIDKEFVEAESAHKTGREEFNRLLSFARNEGIDCIIAHKVDRIARNLDDLANLERLGLKLYFVDQRFDDSPTGKFSYGIMALMAKLYSDNLSQEVKKGMNEKLSQGGFPSRAPLGYLNDRNERTIIIDGERAPFIKAAFNLYSSGDWTLKSLSKELYFRGLRTRAGKRIRPSSLNIILRNPFYYGFMKINDKLYNGNHQPLISKTMFDKVQFNLDNKGTVKRNAHSFPLRGFLVCGECGCKITAEIQRGHTYYRCTKSKGNCGQKYVRAEELNEQVESILARIEIDKDLMELLIESCKVLESGERNHRQEIKNKLTKEYKILTKKIDKLVDTFLDVKIPEDIYNSKLKKLEADRHDIDVKIREIEKKPLQSFEHIEELLKTAQAARKMFVDGDYRTKRQVLNLIASNMILKDRRIVSYQLKEPYNYLLIDPSEDKKRVTWAYVDSNHGPHPYQGCALTS